MSNESTVNLPIDLDGVKWIYTTQDDMAHPLCVSCPHCGYVEYGALQNEWEYIADDTEWEWTCEGCEKDYTLDVTATAILTLKVKTRLPATPHIHSPVSEGV